MVAPIINTPDNSCNPIFNNSSNATNLSPEKRKVISIQALARNKPITDIASHNNVSRKFIYKQKNIADKALEHAFTPVPLNKDVLFYLPVTKKWIRQFVLALVLICHSSFRGVIEILESLFDYHNISLGTVHNIVMEAARKSEKINKNEDISGIRYGASDEIFQNSKPVLAGVDLESTYCYLLRAEDHRDESTWGVHLLDLKERGLQPIYTVADGGKGLRAGQAAAWPQIPCHGDVFHAERELGKLVCFLENRAASATTRREQLENKMLKAKKKGHGQKFSKALGVARQSEKNTVHLASEVKILADWMRDDILSLSGPSLNIREELFNFVVEQLQQREPIYSYKIRPVRRMLQNQRDVLLAFAGTLDKRFSDLADLLDVPVCFIHAVGELQGMDMEHSSYWEKRANLQKELKSLFFKIEQAVQKILEDTPRASSLVENLNSRLRNYFFLRRQVGNDYLELLRFFLNHRRFIRSDRPERKGLSPVEIMTGTKHPHWLESLGFERFCRN